MTEPPLRTSHHGDLTGLPDVLRALAAETWREDAACRYEQDANLFFTEIPPYQSEKPKAMASASMLLSQLICSGCEVRRECLRAALTPPRYLHQDEATATTTSRTWFVWGGSTELDRIRVAHLPVDEQIDALEAGLPGRLERRIAAWRANDSPRSMRSRRGARILQMLSARDVTPARPRPATCGRCAEQLSWRKRADARWCSAACKQAGYRARAAA